MPIDITQMKVIRELIKTQVAEKTSLESVPTVFIARALLAIKTRVEFELIK